MTRVLTAVRRLSCEPALYYRPGADVEKELGLPKGVTFEFNGPRSASLQWTDPPSAAAVAKAAGVAKPVITTAKKGAWALRSWRLGSNATTGELDIWPPGRPMFAVRHDYDAGDKVGMVKPLTGEQLGGWIGIEMPDSAVPVKDDEVAVKLLARAAETLAANPKLLRAPIDEVRKTIGLVGERFRVAHKTHGIGEPASGTVDVQTVRTQVGAMAVVTKLGLMGSIRHSRARDSSHYLLVDGARESHAWRGLTVKARFQLRPAAKYGSEDPDDYLLENLTFSP